MPNTSSVDLLEAVVEDLITILRNLQPPTPFLEKGNPTNTAIKQLQMIFNVLETDNVTNNNNRTNNQSITNRSVPRVKPSVPRVNQSVLRVNTPIPRVRIQHQRTKVVVKGWEQEWYQSMKKEEHTHLLQQSERSSIDSTILVRSSNTMQKINSTL